MKGPSLRQLKNQIRRLDPRLPEDSPSFCTALVMLSTLSAGTNADAIARFTGLPRTLVREKARAMRRNGIWTPRNKLAVEWFRPEVGAVSFWTDSLAVDGLLERVPA